MASESILLATMLQLVVILLAARAANFAFRALGQPGVVGEIVAGLLLGPSLLGHLAPQLSMALFNPKASLPLGIMSQVGLVLLMFQIGSDFEFAHLRQARYRRATIFVAGASVVVPLILGFLIGVWCAGVLAPATDRYAFSLFLGLALAITAVPILGRILREFDLTRSPLGVVTISAAAINDVIGWVLLAAISSYAGAHFSLLHASLQTVAIAIFMGTVLVAGQPLANRLLSAMPLKEGQISSGLLAVVLALMFALAICTQALGIFAIFGGFAAGLAFHRHHRFVEAWRRQVGQFVLVFLLPVFFTYSGLRTDVLGIATSREWFWFCAILTTAIASKIVPTTLASIATGFDIVEAATIGVLMNTRALMELIVLNIGLDLGVIPRGVFSMLVIVAIVTTLMTAPLLRVLLPRGGHVVPAYAEA